MLHAPFVWAQAPTTPLKFEVASVKQHVFVAGDRADFTISGSTVRSSVASLYALIRDAYDVKMDRISGGPAWASRVRDAAFDITANAEGTPTMPQVRLMLQQLLAERFQLKLRREMRDIPTYELVIAKDGSKLKQSTVDAAAKVDVGTRVVSPGLIARELGSERMSLAALADSISAVAGRPVVDKTGLTGSYALKLSWTDDNRPGGNAANTGDSGVSIFTALQEQLGLRLEPAKGPGEFLIIESVEKPSEN